MAAGAGGGVVKVDITHTNAPAGTSTKATASGPGVKVGTLINSKGCGEFGLTRLCKKLPQSAR